MGYSNRDVDWIHLKDWLRRETTRSLGPPSEDLKVLKNSAIEEADDVFELIRFAAYVIGIERRRAGIVAILVAGVISALTLALAILGGFATLAQRSVLGIILFTGVVAAYAVISIQLSSRLRRTLLGQLIHKRGGKDSDKTP